MSVIMTLRPILMLISLIRNKIYITPLKKVKAKVPRCYHKNDASSLRSRKVLKLILKSLFLYYIN